MLSSSFKNVDVLQLIKKIWLSRYSLLKSCSVAFVLSLVIGFSIPKTYQSEVVLAPETAKSPSLGALGSIASLAGFNMGEMGSDDAIYPELYPQIVSSSTLLEELYGMRVTSLDGTINCTLYEYLSGKQKKAWWEYISGFPLKVKNWIFPEKKTSAPSSAGGEAVSYKVYTKAQISLMEKMRKKIVCTVDKGNDVVTITVDMQDPLIAAQVADKVAKLLQEYVTRYRINKATEDYKYTNTLYEEARDNYYKVQVEFADYLDRHALGTIKSSAKTKEDRMEDELALAYSLYCQLAQQKELARAKVQERTPVFSTIQPAEVPVLAVAPRKVFIAVSFVLLAFFGHVVWLMIANEVRAVFKRKRADK